MKRVLKVFQAIGVATALCGTAQAEEQAPRVNLTINAQPMRQALKDLGQQTGLSIVIREGETRWESLKAPKVSGELSAREALERMLENTGLQYRFVNPNTVLVSGKEAKADAGRAELHLAQVPADTLQQVEGKKTSDATAPASSPPEARDSETDDKTELTVTGSRIRSMVGEQTLQPVFIMDRKAIERTGASSLGEVFKRIPQISSSTDGTGLESFDPEGGGSTSSSDYMLTANLRGFSGTQTLILVDGRRVNKNDQASRSDNFDIIGLPLGSVERIEVMLDGASAIYGADAAAGVINIITRKDYNGTEARINYRNMFSTDASNQDYQLSHGISRENWNLSFSASHERTTALASRDLAKTRTSDRRAFGGVDRRAYTYRVVPGWIETADGSNLPGLSTSRAPIPANSTGTGLTVADYGNAYTAVGQPWDPEDNWVYEDFDESLAWGERWDTATVTEEPTQRQNSFRVNGEYSFSDAVSVYASANYLKARTRGSTGTPYATEGIFYSSDTGDFEFASGLTLPAGYPGNPFGVPIILHKQFLDNMSRLDMQRSNMEGMVGIRGDLPKGWRYDVSARLLKSKSEPNYRSSALLQPEMDPLLNSATPPVLLYDGTRRPMPLAGLLFAVSRPMFNTWERPENRTFSADADGPIWRLPAGDVRMALTLESREDSHDTSAETLPPVNGYAFGVGAEVRVPIVSPEMKVRGLHSVDIGIAGRHDRYSAYPEATNPSYRLMIRPVSWLSLRVNRSKGTRVPSLFLSNAIYGTPFEYGPDDGIYFDGPWVDPLRNDEDIEGFTDYPSSNPNLSMETNVTYNYSVAVDVLPVPGLSLTVSHWTTDNFGDFANAHDLFPFAESVRLFPELFIREPSTGPLPGRITGRLYRYINLSASEHAGWDAMAQYNLDTAVGTFDASVNLARITQNNLRATGPEGEIEPSSSGVRNLATQLSGALFWTRGPVSMGTNVTYNSSRFQTQSSNTLIPGSTRWDLQVGYNFANSAFASGGRLGMLAAGTRATLTVFNILNEDPPLVEGQYRFGTIDMKQQSYSLNVTKEF